MVEEGGIQVLGQEIYTDSRVGKLRKSATRICGKPAKNAGMKSKGFGKRRGEIGIKSCTFLERRAGRDVCLFKWYHLELRRGACAGVENRMKDQRISLIGN